MEKPDTTASSPPEKESSKTSPFSTVFVGFVGGATFGSAFGDVGALVGSLIGGGITLIIIRRHVS